MKFILLLLTLLIGTIVADNYDYIIVGGGTAASIVAAELSADPKVKVLVLEQGDDLSSMLSPVVQLWGDRIHGAGNNLSKLYSWNYFVDTQQSQETNLDYRSLVVPKPKLLGGGSSINGVAWNRPSKASLAQWNDPLWTYEATLDDFKALESCQGSSISCDPLYHGFNGPIVTNTRSDKQNSHHKSMNPVFKAVFGLADNSDLNGPIAEGFGALPRNLEVVMNGGLEVPIRQDAYSKVLNPVLDRSKLKVLTGAKAKTLLLKNNGKNEVEYDHRGTIRRDTAKREVIVAAGTYGTPTFLMRSGIGDCDYFANIGIDCQINNTQVGKNLKDGILSSFVVLTPIPAANNSFGAISAGYYKSPLHTGPTTNMEIAFAPFSPLGNVFLIMLGQLVQSSVGEVKLYNSNPHRDPMVTFNLYSNSTEVFAMVDAFKKTRQALANLTAQGLPFIELSPGYGAVPPTATDQEIAAYLMRTVLPEAHCVGTSSLHKVVDSRLRLIKETGEVVKGVRIVDNSIIPELLAEHATAAAAMLIGKRGSRFIKEDWN